MTNMARSGHTCGYARIIIKKVAMTVNGYHQSLSTCISYYASCIVLARVGIALVDFSLTALSSKARRTVTTVVCESNWCTGGILCTG